MNIFWQEFMAGLRDGCPPFLTVTSKFLCSMAVSGVIVFAGVDAIVLGTAMVEPWSSAMIILGQGLLIIGASFGLIAAARARMRLFMAAAVWRKRQ